jgi:hypothetical protein
LHVSFPDPFDMKASRDVVLIEYILIGLFVLISIGSVLVATQSHVLSRVTVLDSGDTRWAARQ